jgi:Skp family chaperone for outer membrane proteins
MKKRDFVVVVFLAGLALIVIGLEYSHAAKEKVIDSPRIGVVSAKEVFENCLMKSEVEKTLTTEGDKKFDELKKLQESIEIDKSALSKRRQDSNDYLEMLKELIMKQSQLEAKKEFYQQELVIKEMQGKEKIYRKILEVIASVAQEKRLDMIFSRDDNYLNRPDSSPPAESPADLVLTTRTHKLFYFNPDMDITADVLNAMGKSN